tara:strand:+ start:1100 stop:1798 length:699 start_codon:yes stop_codon:yes gene_type:complete
MSPEQLGQIDKPSASQYMGKKILFLVPLLQQLASMPPDGEAILKGYWTQVDDQIDSLETGLGPVTRIYHEYIEEGGDSGLEILRSTGVGSIEITESRCAKGATLIEIEDRELLAATMDWELYLKQLLSFPFRSATVVKHLHEWHTDTIKSRYDHILQSITDSLTVDEPGILFVSENHQLQFPADIQVFYVSPPALTDYKRWMETLQATQKAEAEASNPESPDDTTTESVNES